MDAFTAALEKRTEELHAAADEAARVAAGLWPWQWAVWTHPARVRVVVGARRIGKTRLLVREAIRAAKAELGAEVALVGPSLRLARRLLCPALLGALPADEISGRARGEDLAVEIYPWLSQIRVFGADHPELMLGRGFDFVAYDEFGSGPRTRWCPGGDDQLLVQVIGPSLVDHGGRLLLAGTPAGPDDPLLDRFRFAEGNGAGFWVTGAAAAPLTPPDVERRRGDRPWAEFLAEMLPLPSPDEAATDPF